MYGISLLQGMVFYGPIATLYRQNAGLNIFQITLIESISLVLTIALELPWGVIADKIGYRRTMLVCTFLFFVSKIIFWQAYTFLGFLLERILLSAVISGLSGVDSSLLYLSCPEEKSQQTFAVYQQLGTVGLLIASGVYALVIKDDYRFAALLTMISYGLAVILAFGIEEVRDVSNNSISQSKEMIAMTKRLFRNGSLLMFLAGIALVNETHQTITVFLNQLQYMACGMSSQDIGLVYIVMTLSGLLGCFSMQLTKLLKPGRTLKLLIVIPLFCCLVLGLTKQAAISVAAVLLMHIAFQLLNPLQLKIQNHEVVSQQRATELSVNAVVMDALAVMTNLIFGKVADLSLSSAFFLGAVFCLAAYLCCSFYLRKAALTSI